MRENIRRLMDYNPEMRQRRNKTNGRYMGMEDYSGRHGRQIGYEGSRSAMDNRYEMDDPNERYDRYDRYDRMDGTGRSRMTMGKSNASQQMEMGMGDITEYMEEPISYAEAMEWAENLQGGPRWKTDEIKKEATELGMPTSGEEFAEFYAVTNALYSDYHKVSKERGVDDLDFYGKLAKAFIEDKDACENKTAIYYRFIVEQE